MKFYFAVLVIKILSYPVTSDVALFAITLAILFSQCFMPEYFEPQIEDISEAALQERIKLRKVKASVDMFDQLLQAGDQVHLQPLWEHGLGSGPQLHM